MSKSLDSDTNPSLLARLRKTPGDKRSWDQFVERYGTTIYNWCLHWGLQPADADNVVQNVMLDLSRQMERFEYDPNGRFRAWLKTITRRAWIDYSARLRKNSQPISDSILETLGQESAQESLLHEIDDQCRRDMLEIAMRRVENRVKPQTWLAFEMTELKQRSPEDVAIELNLKTGSVYVARSRVQRMLIAEVDLLDRNE